MSPGAKDGVRRKSQREDRLDFNWTWTSIVQWANSPTNKHEIVTNALLTMFGHDNMESPDYISKVLLLETLIKVFMDLTGFNYHQAEEELFEIDVTEGSDLDGDEELPKKV